MSVTKYHRRRKSIDSSLLERLLKFSFSHNYIGFVVTYDSDLLVSLVSKEPHAMGYLNKNERLVKVNFTQVDNLATYIIDYGDSQYSENIVKIAENNIPEGGIYYSLENHKIYNFNCEPEDIPQEERQAEFESFETFFEALKLFKLSNDNIDFKEEWDLDMPTDKDELKFPWES